MDFLDVVSSPFGILCIAVLLLMTRYLSMSCSSRPTNKDTPKKDLNPDLTILDSFEHYIAVYKRSRLHSKSIKMVVELYERIRVRDGYNIDGSEHFVIERGELVSKIYNNLNLPDLEFVTKVKQKYDVKSASKLTGASDKRE